MERKYNEWNIKEETPLQFRETVNTLIEMLIKPECLKRDLFFALLLTVMNENDFQLLKGIGEEGIGIVDYIVSKSGLNNDIYSALFILKGYANSKTRLIMCPMDDLVLITTSLPDMCSETYSICLPIDRYVKTTQLRIPMNCVNLNELRSYVKEKIVSPIRCKLINYNNNPSGALSGLPSDVLHQIIVSLPIRDVLNLSESCRRINSVVNEDGVWSHLYNRDFPDCKTDGTEWQEMYKEIYIMKQEEKFKLTSNVGTEIFEEFIELSDYLRCVPDSRWDVIL